MDYNNELDIFSYVDEAYELCVRQYLESDTLDRDIDEIIYKLVDIADDICLSYITYDDLAENILKENLALFAYSYSNDGIDFTIMDIVENPQLYCNLFIRDLVIEELSNTVLSELCYKIQDFENEYTDTGTEEQYRKMFTDTLLKG